MVRKKKAAAAVAAGIATASGAGLLVSMKQAHDKQIEIMQGEINGYMHWRHEAVRCTEQLAICQGGS